MAAALPEHLGALTVFGTLKAVPAGWATQGTAPRDQTMRVQIGLKQSNMKELEKKLLDISNPDSPNYGKWLSKDEVNAITAPPKENIDTVMSWLAWAEVPDVKQPTPDWMEFTVTVAKMEVLLNARYESFYHAEMNQSIPRTMEYSVPESLHQMIDLITPTTAFYSKIGARPKKLDE